MQICTMLLDTKPDRTFYSRNEIYACPFKSNWFVTKVTSIPFKQC